METKPIELAEYIRDVPDFPKPGINFKDITPLLQSPEAFAEAIDGMMRDWKYGAVEIIAGLDARGFIFGAVLAMKFGVPFIMVRKKGKLPGKTESIEYALEYGTNIIEVSTESLPKGKRVLIVDDLLATGGTARAAADLLEKIGFTVAGFAFVVELLDLHGRERLGLVPTSAVLQY